MFYNNDLYQGVFMEFSKSQIYSLISQRVEKLQTNWYSDLDKNTLLSSFGTDQVLQKKRCLELSTTIDTLISELDQVVDTTIVEEWKKHFSYQIFPINTLFKKALLHFFNPIMINALGMNVLGQAYMLSLLGADDGNDKNFAFKKAKEFMNHINSLLDEPYKQQTLDLFIQSIHINYQSNFLELSVQYSQMNDLKTTYYYFHRKRFDLPLELNNSGNVLYLYNHLNTQTIATESKNSSLVVKFPETLENTVVLRNALFSMLFGNIDYYLSIISTEVNALPLGRSGFVLEEVVDTYAVDLNHAVNSFEIYGELNHEEFAERIANHFSFMHDYLLCDTILYDVAHDLFEKKIYGRSLFLLKQMSETFELKKLFDDSYKSYIDNRFINTSEEFDGIKMS